MKRAKDGKAKADKKKEIKPGVLRNEAILIKAFRNCPTEALWGVCVNEGRNHGDFLREKC